MANYQLSEAAAQDLEAIYLWSAERFGIDQADLYAARLIERLAQIVESPQRWPLVPDLLVGCRRSVVGSHAIYYEMEPTGAIFVSRVLGRQEPSSALS